MKWNRDKKTVEISIAAACILLGLTGGLLAWTVGQCCQYAFWNRSLTAENGELSNLLADRSQTIDEKTEEIESLQAQLADMLISEPEKQEEPEPEESEDIEKHHIFKDLCGGEVQVELHERRDCDELEEDLPRLSGCSVHAEIGEWGLNVEQTAGALRRHWKQLGRRDGSYVSLTFFPETYEESKSLPNAEKELQGMQDALLMLAGTEYEEMIREAMAQEEGYLWFVRLEQVGELTCCTFEVGEPAYSPIPINEQAYTPDCYPKLEEEKNDFVYYYVAVEGKWEGKEVKGQCFRIPYPFETTNSIGEDRIEGIDLNFDGKKDLLIRDMFYGWCDCRALVWEEEAGRFAYFPSFPANVYRLETDRQRIVDSGAIGEWMQYVLIYEIINGEYVCTQKLILLDQMDGTYELSCYEMGELAEVHMLSSDWEEMREQRAALYPDMDYWEY